MSSALHLKQKFTPAFLQKLILAWFDLHGRKTLPWQENKTPYRIWVSEIMLQQTQVNTVIPYFNRFMQELPTLTALADASEDHILHLWTGLGYYTRARNLHRAAKKIMTEFQGVFPHTLATLQTLPGVGRSTAGAILALAYQQCATILDGNVKRVLTRLFGITTWPGNKETVAQLWEIAESLTPNRRVADYTQAMMDLGATVCVRGKPHCQACPLASVCIAQQLKITHTIPRAKPLKQLRVKQATLFILQHNTEVLLEKRPPTGIWGGLWSLPEVAGWQNLADIHLLCKRWGVQKTQIEIGEVFRHTFSHFHLDILPAWIHIRRKPTKVMAGQQQLWYNLRAPSTIGLPAPIKKILESLNHAPHSLCQTE